MSLMENFIFCAVFVLTGNQITAMGQVTYQHILTQESLRHIRQCVACVFFYLLAINIKNPKHWVSILS